MRALMAHYAGFIRRVVLRVRLVPWRIDQQGGVQLRSMFDDSKLIVCAAMNCIG